MTFRVGQKVVCVNADSPGKWTPSSVLTLGAIYTVRALGSTVKGEPGVRLHERILSSSPGHVGVFTKKPFTDNFYSASRFRPVVERKTDISIFKAMLKPQRVDA